MKKIFTGTILVLALSLALTACGSAGPSPTVVHVTLSEFKIEMDKTSIPAGPVKFIIENKGTIVHELVLEPGGTHDEPFELNGVESEKEDIAVGSTVELEWTIDNPGDYQLSCYTEDHFDKGMTTPFTVTAP